VRGHFERLKLIGHHGQVMWLLWRSSSCDQTVMACLASSTEHTCIFARTKKPCPVCYRDPHSAG